MSVRLFVYGTLKEGFPNHRLNPGRRVAGEFRTAQPRRLHVVKLAHEDRAPWLLDPPQGHLRVRGQVFEVDEADLPALDAFEEVGLPGGYTRTEIEVEPIGAASATWRVQAYVKRADPLAEGLAVEGPFEDYTLALAEGYWLAPAP